jgi:simple sugar transport system permease protein
VASVAGFDIRLERNLQLRWWHAILVPVLSVLAAVFVGGVFLILTDRSPATVYRSLLEAGFTTWFGFTDSVSVGIPLVFTGLAAAFAFRMNLYNIGAEGQLYAGAMASAWAGLALAPGLPRPLALVVVLLAGAIGGALWIVVPALTRAFLGTSEIITTLLLNYVALYLMRYLIYGSASYWRDPTSTNFPQGKVIDPKAQLAVFGTTRIHWGIVVALALVVVLWLVHRFTSFGFDMKVLGDSPSAARYAGIPIRRTVIVVLLISGALGGLAGASEVAGRAYTLDPNGLALSLGYTGIVVAALARYNPFGVALVAVLMGGLQNAGISLQSTPGNHIPIAISYMLEGIILLFALGGEVFRRNRLVVRRTRPPAGDVQPVGNAVEAA